MSVTLVYKMVVVASRRIVLGLLLVVLSQAVVASGQQGNLATVAIAFDTTIILTVITCTTI